MARRLRRIVIAFLVSAGLATAQQNKSIGDLTNLDIDQLINVTVTSATKSQGITLRKAPGVVRVITRQDIVRYGFVTLGDALATIPGAQVQQYRAGHESIWLRGLKQRYTDKILWLIDGVPIRDSYYGHNDLDSLPLFVVERIEVINGPGGVLYGTNAFSGVVSITTRHEGRSVRLDSGSLGEVGGGVEVSKGGVYAAAERQHTDGFHPPSNSDGSSYRRPEDRDRTFGMLKMERGDFQANAGYSSLEFADAYRKALDNRIWTREPMWGSLGYKHDLGANVHLHVLGYFEKYGLQRAKTTFSKSGNLTAESVEHLASDLYGVDVTASFKAGAHDLIMGTSFQGDASRDSYELTSLPTILRIPQLAVPFVRRTNLGVFAQDVWALNESLNVTAGVRSDYLSDFENQFSYHAGLTGQRNRFYGKLLYGTAYRVPSYREYLSDMSYNLSLRPEHANTLEAQAGVALSHADFSLTFYDNRYHDLITEINVVSILNPDGTIRMPTSSSGYAMNADRSVIRGVELQATVLLTSRMSATGSLGRILSARERLGPVDPSLRFVTPVITGETNAKFLAGLTANTAWSYRLSRRGDQVSLNGYWMTNRLVPPEYQQKVPAALRNPANADGFFKLDISGIIPIYNRLAVNLRATNLLNKQIYTPPFDDPTGYDAQWPGRALRVELVWRY